MIAPQGASLNDRHLIIEEVDTLHHVLVFPSHNRLHWLGPLGSPESCLELPPVIGSHPYCVSVTEWVLPDDLLGEGVLHSSQVAIGIQFVEMMAVKVKLEIAYVT